MHCKKQKKIKHVKRKEEELPSFLKNLKAKPQEKFKFKKPSKEAFLGTVFFGGCQQFHPPVHSLNLGKNHEVLVESTSRENILKSFFMPEAKKVERPPNPTIKLHYIKPPKFFEDIYTHHCPGVRRTTVPGLTTRPEDLGETRSVITAETIRELPVCRLIQSSSRTSNEKYEVLHLSDIQEKKRKILPYPERIAHDHFIKEFVTVRVFGPKIPKDIVIRQLRTKRKRLSYMNFRFGSQSTFTDVSESKSFATTSTPRKKFVRRKTTDFKDGVRKRLEGYHGEEDSLNGEETSLSDLEEMQGEEDGQIDKDDEGEYKKDADSNDEEQEGELYEPSEMNEEDLEEDSDEDY